MFIIADANDGLTNRVFASGSIEFGAVAPTSKNRAGSYIPLLLLLPLSPLYPVVPNGRISASANRVLKNLAKVLVFRILAVRLPQEFRFPDGAVYISEI